MSILRNGLLTTTNITTNIVLGVSHYTWETEQEWGFVIHFPPHYIHNTIYLSVSIAFENSFLLERIHILLKGHFSLSIYSYIFLYWGLTIVRKIKGHFFIQALIKRQNHSAEHTRISLSPSFSSFLNVIQSANKQQQG